MSEENGSVDTGNPAESAGTWTEGFSDDLMGVVQAKGWQGPQDVLNSYTNLEKLMGADKAGRGVVIPKEDGPQEDWDGFYNRLGRPEKAEDYQLPLPEGDDGEFAKTASQWFHEAGLTSKQAQSIAAKWNETQAAIAEQQQNEFDQQSALDVQSLQEAWGDKFELKSELARRARREAGLSDEEGQAIEKVLGLKKAAEVFSKLGQQFAESEMKGGESKVNSVFGGTPEDAKARISALKNDKAWVSRYLNGDVDAKSEMNRLHAIAYPSG